MSININLPNTRNYPKVLQQVWALSNKWFVILIFVIVSILIVQCGLDVEDPTPPSPPQWVPKSLPEEWPERGIDAHESIGIFLEWENNSAENIDSYHIYRATWFDNSDSLGRYELIALLEAESILKLEFKDLTAVKRIRYFYKLRIEDDTGNLSNFSEPQDYMLITKVATSTMSPNGQYAHLDSNRTLAWRYDLDIAMEDYVITLLTSEFNILHRDILQPGNYFGGAETWKIPLDIPLISGNIYLWRIDTGANYLHSIERTGSESEWARFVY